MTTLEAMRAMIDAAGMSTYAVACEIGRTSSYVSGMFRRGSVPGGDVLARIARACGYRLALIPNDDAQEVIYIDADS